LLALGITPPEAAHRSSDGSGDRAPRREADGFGASMEFLIAGHPALCGRAPTSRTEELATTNRAQVISNTAVAELAAAQQLSALSGAVSGTARGVSAETLPVTDCVATLAERAPHQRARRHMDGEVSKQCDVFGMQ